MEATANVEASVGDSCNSQHKAQPYMVVLLFIL